MDVAGTATAPPLVVRSAPWAVWLAVAFALFFGTLAFVTAYGMDGDTPPGFAIVPGAMALAAACVAGYQRMWSVVLDDDGVLLVRPSERVRLAWAEIATVEVEASVNRAGTKIYVRPRKGTGRSALRWRLDRLSKVDRRRLGQAFAERGFPLQLA